MACRPYNTGRCLLLRLFNPSKLWGSLQFLLRFPLLRNPAYAAAGVCEVDIVAVHVLLFLVTVHKDTKYWDYNKDFYRELKKSARIMKIRLSRLSCYFNTK